MSSDSNHPSISSSSSSSLTTPISLLPTNSPFLKKWSTPSQNDGQLVTPQNTLVNQDILSSMDETERKRTLNARTLLPFNYGRSLDPNHTQHLQAVGEPTLNQQQSGRIVPKLFESLTLGQSSVQVKNRIWVSPMCQYSCDDGHFNDWHLVHLGQFAIGGASLIVFEATAVSSEGRISPTDSGLWKDSQIAPLRRVVEFINSQKSVAGIQLAHAGRKASTIPPFHAPHRLDPTVAEAVDDSVGGWPAQVIGASSERFASDYWVPNEMSRAEIDRIKQGFIDSTKRAIQAGFKYIEIHGAHGYLITSFLSARSNKRTDEYGGSFENRIRLLLEIVKSVRATAPRSTGIALGVRLTCFEWVDTQTGGWSIEDTTRLVQILTSSDEYGIDVIDCSSGGNSVDQKITVTPGYQVPFASAVRKVVPSNVVVAAVGTITDAHQAEKILQEGSSDVVMLAREFLRNPQWPLQAAIKLGYDMTWAPQYQRAKPSATVTAGTRS